MFLRFLLCAGLLGVALAQDLQPASFPQVTIQGTARPDAGYFVEHVTVAGKVYSAAQIEQAGQAALLGSGWKSADAKTRQKLALDWCTQVATAGKVVTQPGTVGLEKDGNIHVRLSWTGSGGNVAGALRPTTQGHWSVTPGGVIKSITVR